MPASPDLLRVSFPDLRGEEVGDGAVRFTQTAGGQPGMPSPRRVRRRPYLQVSGPVVWSTLALTVRADGTSSFEVVGASSFPRHWIYGHDGTVVAKTGLIDFATWYGSPSARRTLGDEESPTVVRPSRPAERELRHHHRSEPPFGGCATGEVLVSQGEPGDELSPLRRVLPWSRTARRGRGRPRAILGEMACWREPAHGHQAGGDPLRVAVGPGDRSTGPPPSARRRRDGG